MIQIIGPPLSQWDTGRSMEASGSTATHAHFANRGDSHAVIMELVDGKTKIPDYLLQTNKDLFIYLVLDGVTQESKTFSVRKREKPENYVYEDDQRNYIYKLIEDAHAATDAANQVAQDLLKDKENGAFNGKDGKSAYEIAVQNGFEGTEAEWLESLKGEDGKDGGGSANFFVNFYHDESGLLSDKSYADISNAVKEGLAITATYLSTDEHEYQTSSVIANGFEALKFEFFKWSILVDEYEGVYREKGIYDSIGDISTALDRIIALQEDLIGIKTITVHIGTGEYIAMEGMTWAEWCESDYNTIGAYITDDNFVAFSDFYLSVFTEDGTEVVRGNDVIDPTGGYEFQ